MGAPKGARFMVSSARQEPRDPYRPVEAAARRCPETMRGRHRSGNA
jgi:hypothetical protein